MPITNPMMTAITHAMMKIFLRLQKTKLGTAVRCETMGGEIASAAPALLVLLRLQNE